MSRTQPGNLAASVADRLLQRSRRTGEDYQVLLTRYSLFRLCWRPGGRNPLLASGRRAGHGRNRKADRPWGSEASSRVGGGYTSGCDTTSATQPNSRAIMGGAGRAPIPPRAALRQTFGIWNQDGGGVMACTVMTISALV